MNRFPITASGFNKLKEEIQDLKYRQRPQTIQAISEAREFGDLSENAEYKSAKEKQAFIEGKIRDLEDKFGRAEIIDPLKLSLDSVKFGTSVELIDDDTKNKQIFHIVGEYESDMSLNRISIKSPLARALIGKSIGDIAEVLTPKGERFYEISGLKAFAS